MFNPTDVILGMLLVAVCPAVIGWRREIWIWYESSITGYAGRAGEFMRERSRSSSVLWVAPVGPIAAIVAIGSRWGGPTPNGFTVAFDRLGENPWLVAVGGALYSAGVVTLALAHPVRRTLRRGGMGTGLSTTVAISIPLVALIAGIFLVYTGLAFS